MEPIQRREAKSGKVSYTNPVVIHETSQRRVVVVPFFVPHSDHTELAIKITSYRKVPPPNDWAVIEEKSVSLNESAARKLLTSLRSDLAVSEEESDGSYLVIRVSEGTAELGKHDPASVAIALTNVLGKEEIVDHLADAELSDEFVSAFRDAIRLNEMRSAVAKLREHLENGDTSEQIYQEWCESHSWAFGNAYVDPDELLQQLNDIRAKTKTTLDALKKELVDSLGGDE